VARQKCDEVARNQLKACRSLGDALEAVQKSLMREMTFWHLMAVRQLIRRDRFQLHH